MSEKIEFVLELTRDEAVALCLAHGAAAGTGFAKKALTRIALALEAADPALDSKQMYLYRLNQVHYEIGDTVPWPKDWA